MDPIQITTLNEEQLSKIEEMYTAFHRQGEYEFSKHSIFVHWLEISLYYLLPKIAEERGKQPYTTPNWSAYMVKQKIVNELETTNPIDTLYDIWKHPDKYAQTI